MVVGDVLGCVWDVQQLQPTSNGRGEVYIYRPPSLVAVAPTVS